MAARITNIPPKGDEPDGLDGVPDTDVRRELRSLLERRRNGPFLTEEKARAETREMLRRKRAELGL